MLVRSRRLPPLFSLAFVCLCLIPATLPAQGIKKIMGVAEHALISPEQIRMRAKLDSGAKTTSLHAPQITHFMRTGKQMVRFTVKGEKGGPVKFEKEVVRTAKIKRHTGSQMERPVILFGICLGRVYRKVEVNLVDRGRFQFPLLIGRNFMAGHIIIDPELTYTAKPDCNP